MAELRLPRRSESLFLASILAARNKVPFWEDTESDTVVVGSPSLSVIRLPLDMVQAFLDDWEPYLSEVLRLSRDVVLDREAEEERCKE